MAKKKLYNESNNKKNVKVKNKDTSKKDFKEIKSLEDTMSIKIDKILNDSDILDNSFLEGRIQNKDKKNIKKSKTKKVPLKTIIFWKKLSYILSGICLITLIILILLNNVISIKQKKSIDNNDTTTVEKSPIDNNFLFIGDFHTENMDIKNLGIEVPYVKVSEKNMTTTYILENIEKSIYIYNPSVIFLEVGIEDILSSTSEEELLTQLEKIIMKIKENRPYAKIYVESLYPINSNIEGFSKRYDDITNSMIEEINEEIRKKSTKLGITYIDLFSKLIENNELKEENTIDGINLNEQGYMEIWKVLNEIIQKDRID